MHWYCYAQKYYGLDLFLINELSSLVSLKLGIFQTLRNNFQIPFVYDYYNNVLYVVSYFFVRYTNEPQFKIQF